MLAPGLETLAKVSLPAFLSLCSYITLTPPHPHPNAEERKKYKTTSTSLWEKGPFNVVIIGKTLHTLTQLVNFVEFLSIVQPIILREPLGGSRTALVDVRATTIITVGLALVVVGTWMRWEAYRRLGRRFTYFLSIQKDHKLTTDGVYSIVRHPGYTGLFMNLAGNFLCQFGPGSYWAEVVVRESKALGYWYCALCGGLSVALSVGLFMRIDEEDSVLREMFKEQWDAWARRTRYKLIPFIF